MITQLLEIAKIRCDAGTQSRARSDEDQIEEYAERMAAGDKFPLLDVFFDGKEYFLADGFHRLLAAIRNKLSKFECVVHKGTLQDALWFSLGANKKNGLHRSKADKQKVIELAIVKFPDKTQEQIALHVGCNQSTVQRFQSQLMQTHKLKVPERRMGADGKSRPTKYGPPPSSRPPSSPPSRQNAKFAVSEVCDKTGLPIPAKRLELWNRRQEVQDMLTALSRIKCTIENAHEQKDVLFAEVNRSGVRADLVNAYNQVELALPYAVCPSCQGHVAGGTCRLCDSRGLISEFRWKQGGVTIEAKAMRAKQVENLRKKDRHELA